VSIQNEEKVMSYAERFREIVATGGFKGFFLSADGDHAQATLNALLVIKAIDAAALLRRAMCLFECGTPPQDRTARRQALDQIPDEGRTILRQLDQYFPRCNNELEKSLNVYSWSLEERCYVTR
jgi:hypothetical protein